MFLVVLVVGRVYVKHCVMDEERSSVEFLLFGNIIIVIFILVFIRIFFLSKWSVSSLHQTVTNGKQTADIFSQM